jgi:hypothetical protein
MSQSSLQEFLGRIPIDTDLEWDFDRALAMKQGGVAAVVALGARHGYEFTPREFADFVVQAQQVGQVGELSDDDLEAVSGGTAAIVNRTSPSVVASLQGFEDPLTAFEDPLTAVGVPPLGRGRP